MKRRLVEFRWLRRLVVFLFRGRRYQAEQLYLDIQSRLGRIHRQPVSGKTPSLEYVTRLPEGFGAQRAVVRLSAPEMPVGQDYSFSEHVMRDGKPTDTVIACTVGGFAISEDLGRTWKHMKVKGFGRYPILHARMLSNGEILLQATDLYRDRQRRQCHLLVVDLEGKLLSSTKVDGAYWHGPRSIDMCEQTLMYAEYTPNPTIGRRSGPTKVSRVLRSRDFGRSWNPVFETDRVRHFHFLQARPGQPGEWWLSSGDAEEECRIWRSTDDGDTWTDLTADFGFTVESEPMRYTRRIFRLTDLAWLDDGVLWGTDDPLKQVYGEIEKQQAALGARAFLWSGAGDSPPRTVGFCGRSVRSIVELEEHFVFITQAELPYSKNPPTVLMMPKRTDLGSDALVPLFEVESFNQSRPGFTYSRASRAAKDGVFFTYRSADDVFARPGRILRWEVELD